jgi:hypothetical protein
LHVCSGLGALQRNTHAKQIAFAVLEARKTPATTISPPRHEDARDVRLKGKQTMHGAQNAGRATAVGLICGFEL